jgi:hypothetical protein
MLTDDRVLLRADPERDVLVRDPAQHVVEGRRLRINQLHRVRHDRARQGLALLTGGLVALIEDAQQLRMGGKHAGIEASRDLVGMGRDHRRGCLDHAERRGRQQRWARSIGKTGHGFSPRCSGRHLACQGHVLTT